MKSMRCEKCVHATFFRYGAGGGINCAKNQNPGFVTPKSPTSKNYGWRKKGCKEYGEK